MNSADLPTRARAALAYFHSVTSRSDLVQTVKEYIATLEKQVSDLRFILEKRDEIEAQERQFRKSGLLRHLWRWINNRKGGQ